MSESRKPKPPKSADKARKKIQGNACVSNAANLAKHITGTIREDPNYSFRNRSFSEQAEHNKAVRDFYEEKAAVERMKALRDRVHTELREMKEKCPCATECEILEKLIESNAHPMTISLQRSRIEKMSQGQPVSPMTVSTSFEAPVPAVQEQQRTVTEEDYTTDITYNRPYIRSTAPKPQGFYEESSARDRAKTTRDTILREMKMVKEQNPGASESVIFQKLIECNAHPQTIALQQEKLKQMRAGQGTRQSKIPFNYEDPSMDEEKDQFPRKMGKINPLLVPIKSKAQKQSQATKASGKMTKCEGQQKAQGSKMPVALENRPLPRTPSGRIQEISLREEANSTEERRRKGWSPQVLPQPRNIMNEYFAESVDAGPATVRSIPQLPSTRRYDQRYLPSRGLRSKGGRLPVLLEEPDWLENTQSRIEAVRARFKTPKSGLRTGSSQPLTSTGDQSSSWGQPSEISPIELQGMIEEERREIRNMHSVMSQIREPATQLQFKDMATLVPHIFSEETETAPEVAAAILNSDEKGLSLKSTPAQVYDTLFQGPEAEKTVIKVNAPSTHTKGGVLVPMSSEGVEASLIGYETGGLYEVLQDPEDENMPKIKNARKPSGSHFDKDTNKLVATRTRGILKQSVTTTVKKVDRRVKFTDIGLCAVPLEWDNCGQTRFLHGTFKILFVEEAGEPGTLRENLGYSVSSIGKESQVSVSSEDGRFRITLHPEYSMKRDLIQIRGSQPPPWFPGYYVIMGDDKEINAINKPWTVLEKAWREFVPEKIKTDTGKIIVGS